jgi:hypothetical protein
MAKKRDITGQTQGKVIGGQGPGVQTGPYPDGLVRFGNPPQTEHAAAAGPAGDARQPEPKRKKATRRQRPRR